MLKSIKDIKFIKKDGRIQDFDESKMLGYLNKIGIPGRDAEIILGDFFEEVNPTLHTAEVISALERVAARRISPISPKFEEYAGILYLEQAKNRDYGGKYPHIRILSQAQNIDWSWVKFNDEEIEELNSYIKPERDGKFIYKSADIFHRKYCIKLLNVEHPVTGQIQDIKELPQIAYMRVAMFLTSKLPGDVRVAQCKKIYDDLSLHKFTLATPIMVNALTKRPQTSSCVLMTVEDSTDSLLDINTKIGVMSKHIAGVACNIQKIRSRGSSIGTGVTSGPIPFLKVFEATVSAWNQGGTRPGALCIYFQWWHPDVIDMLSLKSNGGTDENRARRLKYALKINDLFIRKVLANEPVALVSPHNAPELYGLYGEKFEVEYQKYLDDPNTTKIPAREIWVKLFKERSETGNIYLFHEENVNIPSMLNEYIGSSNLCTEVVLPSSPSVIGKSERCWSWTN